MFGLRARTSRFPRLSRSRMKTAITTSSTRRLALRSRRRPASRVPLRMSPSVQLSLKASVSNGRLCERSRVRCASVTLRPATGSPRKIRAWAPPCRQSNPPRRTFRRLSSSSNRTCFPRVFSRSPRRAISRSTSMSWMHPSMTARTCRSGTTTVCSPRNGT